MLDTKEQLIEGLSLTYAITVASEPLIETALEESMPIELKDFYEKHLKDERRHVQWVLADLKALDAVPYIVDWRIAPIVGMQYYLIKHVAPECLLGYMAYLEGSPTPIEEIERLETIHGKAPIRTIRYHAEHDVAHSKDILQIIDSLGDKIDQELVADTMQHTAGMFDRAFVAIRKDLETR